MRYSCAVAICLLSPVAALGYPRPPEGTENIPKLMEEATVVCNGEVTSAPKPLSVGDAPRTTGTATVRVDRCFKGDPGSSEIRVSVDSFLPPGGGPAFILNPGDYRVFFLKSLDGKYAVVDEWFAALRASRDIAHAPAGGDPKLLLDLSVKTSLHDSEP